MKRRPFIAGNWKMHLTASEAEGLVRAVVKGLHGNEEMDIAVAPPFPYLLPAAKWLAGTPVALAAQNLHWEPQGAYTGEVSGVMLRDAGCCYVIVGHSERRQFFHETNETVCRRLKAALAAKLIPILCVGETLEERRRGMTRQLVETQILEALKGIPSGDLTNLVVAYEPVWAIGTGETATPGQAQEIHDAIRGLMQKVVGEETARQIRIQYGGSVKPDNARELMSQPDIDGALVGGASLKAESFLAIIRAGL